MAERVTACLIVMNEHDMVTDALTSIEFCDEAIVVDGGSTDGTPELAAALGARVVHNEWPGFSRQRNVALDAASSEWILEIDADERVSGRLREEIEAFLAAPPPSVDMAVMPLRDIFLGRALGPSSRYPMYRCRLFRRDAYRHDERRAVHEGLWPNGEAKILTGDLVHILASSWREAFSDCTRYARLQALHYPRPGALRLVSGAVLRPCVKLGYRTIVLGGWRDGWQGLARIGFECLSDALAWLYAVRSGETRATDAYAAPRTGPPHVVGLALTTGGAAGAAASLERAAELGADVALLTRVRADANAVRVHRLEGIGLGHITRQLEAESQLRPIDAIVPFDGASSVLARLLRPRLRRLVRPTAGAELIEERFERSPLTARPEVREETNLN